MKLSAWLLSVGLLVGLNLALVPGAAAQTFGGSSKKLTAALNDLATTGRSDAPSVRRVLDSEFFGAIRKSAEAGKYNEVSALRNELLNWIRASSSPQINQSLQNELEKQAKSMASTSAGDPVLVQVVLVLNELNSPTSRNALLSLIKHQDSGVRYLAAAGLFKMISDPNNKLTLTDEEIKIVGEAAAKETNGPTLARYQMIFNTVNTPAAQEALVKTLNARLSAWANLDSATLEADKVAVAAIRGFYPTLNPAQRQAVHATLGALLHGVVNTYVAKCPQLSDLDRVGFVLLISELEKTCQTVSPDKTSVPTLTDASKAKDAERKLQVAGPQWWGEPGTKGIMEGPPWNLPAGGGLTSPTSTQPATMPATQPAK